MPFLSDCPCAVTVSPWMIEITPCVRHRMDIDQLAAAVRATIQEQLRRMTP